MHPPSSISLGPASLIICLVLGCGGSTLPATQTATEAPAAPGPAQAEAPPPTAAPEAEPAPASLAEPEAATDSDLADTGGEPAPSDLSDGETRTMKVIQQTVLENRAKFRACYDAAQAKQPELQGDLTLYFLLDADGKVKEAALNEARSTLKDEEVAKCAIQEVRKLKFPPSSKGLETKVNYPFNFNPK